METASEERVTFCRICEATCGMVATVEDGVLTKLRPDRDNPVSRGAACPKGIAMTDVQNDPDRVVHPLRRNPVSGEFERVSWEQAIAEIGKRLRSVIDEHGADSVAWYFGNPGAFSYSHTLWVSGFIGALGTPHLYTASSQDVSNRFAASALLYGSPALLPIPDIVRTDLLLMIGANPYVSHGSIISAPRLREQLHEIVGRGGRVVVVDPRRTETARHFEHLQIRPDTDAWMLLSLLCVLVEEGLTDEAALASQTSGWAELRETVKAFPPEETEERTGIVATELRQLARDIAAAPSAAVYGRTGSCLGRFGTLVAFLMDTVSIATGNLDRPGGWIFGDSAVTLDKVAARAGFDTFGKISSRIGGLPDVVGALPASLLAEEMTTPGKGQIRAFFTSAGNPVLSCPDGPALERAMEGLELQVSLDLYVTETNRNADYILPATTFLERDDLPIAFLALHTTPFVQYTEPVVEPRGEAREEWQIIDQIARAAGLHPYALGVARFFSRLGVRPSPKRLVDALLRLGPKGDLFGLRRGGMSLKSLSERPHGVVTAAYVKTGNLKDRLYHADRRVHLDVPEIAAEIERLQRVGGGDPDYPLLLIGLRELRSHNTWMHNSQLLTRGGREQPLRMHPDDGARLGLEDGGLVRVASKSGELEVAVRMTDEVMVGVVALPHGWGHRGGGWQRANETPGVNVNVLASAAAEDLEPLAGIPLLNGIEVSVQAVRSVAESADVDRVGTPA